jgi:hypothetical protein
VAQGEGPEFKPQYQIKLLKKQLRWNISVILDTQEANVGELWFKVSPSIKSVRAYSKNKLAVVTIPASQKAEVGGLWSKTSQGKRARCYLKIKEIKVREYG